MAFVDISQLPGRIRQRIDTSSLPTHEQISSFKSIVKKIPIGDLSQNDLKQIGALHAILEEGKRAKTEGRHQTARRRKRDAILLGSYLGAGLDQLYAALKEREKIEQNSAVVVSAALAYELGVLSS